MPEATQDGDGCLAEARRIERKQVRPEGVGVAPAGQRNRAQDAAQPGEGIVCEAVRVDRGLVASPALQPDRAFGRRGEPVLDVGVEHPGVEAVERGFAREVGARILGRRELLPPAQRTSGQRVRVLRGEGADLGEHDRLEAVQGVEGAWSSLLGEEERGGAHRVPEAEKRVREAESIDHVEDVLAERLPIEAAGGRPAGVAVGTLVEPEAVEGADQLTGHRSEDVRVEPGRVDEEERRSFAAEVVHGELGSVTGDETSHGENVVEHRHRHRHRCAPRPVAGVPAARTVDLTQADGPVVASRVLSQRDIIAAVASAVAAGGPSGGPSGVPRGGPSGGGRPDCGSPDPLSVARARSAAHGYGLLLGHGTDGPVFAPAEISCLVCGPPRGGKSTCLVVPNILSAMGPVVTTSTKTDVLEITVAARRRAGRCWLFDPSGTVPCPPEADVLRWSPIASAGSWDDAVIASKAMIRASVIGDHQRGSDAHWVAQSSLLLAPLLHATALSGGGVQDLRQAVSTQEIAEPLAVLERARATAAASDLAGVAARSGPERSGIFSTAADVLEAYRSDAAVSRASDANFDPHDFVRSGETVYICAPAQQQAALAPVVVAFLDVLVRATYARAAVEARRGPPVVFVLDEVANIAPIPDLPSIVSEGGSQGALVLACFQDLSQARARWGAQADGFATLFGANIVLPGIRDRRTLDLYAELAGDEDVVVRSHTAQQWRWWYRLLGRRFAPPTVTTSLRRQRRLPVAALSRGRPQASVLFQGAAPPVWIRLAYWRDDPVMSRLGTPPR